ncbi:hypothetical protein I4U23_005800 [Adineta vaga]|nr:hypothetical protein I4U23_005800 [Adineta vaga]
MSSSNTTMSNLVNDIERLNIFNQIWNICLIIFGIIGHTLSIYVFTRRPFRSSPCTHYFMASTLSGCAVVCSLVPLRLLQVGYYIDVFIYSNPTCQILSYLLFCFRIVPSWLMTLASIDRFLCTSSSAKYRKWSSIRVATRAIPLTILFVFLLQIHAPFYQGIILYPQRSCTSVTSTYRTFWSIWNLVIWSWIPTIFMLVFGFLTIRNVRQGRRRIVTSENISNPIHRNQNKIDRQFLQMLTIQCLVFITTTSIGSISQLYVTIASNMIKSELEKLRDRSLGNAGSSIANFSSCMSFYLFTLSSKSFRRELIHLFYRQQLTTQESNRTKRNTIPRTVGDTHI